MLFMVPELSELPGESQEQIHSATLRAHVNSLDAWEDKHFLQTSLRPGPGRSP
jgi:hypothetical protein